jgi:hypothetical protein
LKKKNTSSLGEHINHAWATSSIKYVRTYNLEQQTLERKTQHTLTEQNKLINAHKNTIFITKFDQLNIYL